VIDHPVVHVTRAQASQYAAWVGGKLPSVSEWLRACQGTDGRVYPWGDQLPDTTLANYGSKRTASVGSYLAGSSPYGALDIAGNVWEWVEPSVWWNVLERDSARGGAFTSDMLNLTCDAQLERGYGYDFNNVGFRVVLLTIP
jgi:formylglycine-generating enzyme required for sulfatase activity